LAPSREKKTCLRLGWRAGRCGFSRDGSFTRTARGAGQGDLAQDMVDMADTDAQPELLLDFTGQLTRRQPVILLLAFKQG
jgi:hypothetical protein